MTPKAAPVLNPSTMTTDQPDAPVPPRPPRGGPGEKITPEDVRAAIEPHRAEAPAPVGPRPTISKRLRFEVFKRDKFACQYCGTEAPTVVLQVDHIEPRARGGADDIVNYVTSCVACNAGKGARALSDDSAVAKSKRQMDELQDRREQIEMMLSWRTGLLDSHEEQIDAVCRHFERYTTGLALNREVGRVKIANMVRRHGPALVMEAVEAVCQTYLRFDGAGKCTSDSFNYALGKLSGTCQNTVLAKKNPIAAEDKRVVAMLRARCYRMSGGDFDHARQTIECAREWGLSFEEILELASHVGSVDEFYGKCFAAKRAEGD